MKRLKITAATISKIVYGLTLFAGLCVFILFEIVLCNGGRLDEILKGDASFHFSALRIAVYVIALAAFVFFGKRIRRYLVSSGCLNASKIAYFAVYGLVAGFVGFYYLYTQHLNHHALSKVGVGSFAIVMLLTGICILFLGDRAEVNFLVAGLTLMMALPFTALILHMIDEFAHFSEAYNVSLGHFLNVKSNAVIPAAYLKVPLGMNYVDFLRQYQGAGLKGLAALNPKNVGGSPAGYPAVFYLPAAIGLFVGRILHFGVINEFYIGRVFCLLFYVFSGYLILRVIPFAKNTVLVILMAPYLVLLSSCYSVDGIGIVLALFFIAYCLHIAYNKIEIRSKQYLILFLSAFLLILFKGAAYSPALLFLLMIPGKRLFKNEKLLKVIRFVVPAVLILGAAAGCVLLYRYMPLGMGDPRGPGVNDIVLQFRNIVSYPIHAVYAYCLFIVNNVSNSTWWIDILPSYFFGAGADMFIPMLALWFCVAGTDTAEIEPDKLRALKLKILLLVYSAASMFLVTTAMYLSYTEVGSAAICGVQTRYIFPLLPAVLMIFTNLHMKNPRKHYVQTVSFAAVMILFVAEAQNILR